MDKSTSFLKMFNNLLLCVSQLAENVPLGGEDYVSMVCELYASTVFSQLKDNFNPASKEAVDICHAFIESLHDEGIIDKKDYEFFKNGDIVKIKVSKKNCSYYEYCHAVREKNLPTVCFRMSGCRWITSQITGRQYQLVTEPGLDPDWCLGTIYPGEKISEILSKDGDKIFINGERAIVLTTKSFGILMKTIYEYAPHLLERVLFESTYYSSLAEYEKVKAYYNTSYEIIEHLLKAANRLGNIRYEIMQYDEINKTAVIRGYGSYMAEIYKNNDLFYSPKASCASARGRLSAYFTKAWGVEIACEEMKCEAFGDDYCEFSLLPQHAEELI